MIEVMSRPTEKEIAAACSPEPTTSANEPLALDWIAVSAPTENAASVGIRGLTARILSVN